MINYFKQIDEADIVIIKNEKNGEEYCGVGTTLELGYAFAKGKMVLLTKRPTNPNLCVFYEILPTTLF
jgi:nucleoside 2-deoxyribosyltransferase